MIKPRLLLTGATGFVGGAVYSALLARGYEVTSAARDPGRAARRLPGRRWICLDVDDPKTLAPALRGHEAALYLVHGMRGGRGDYLWREVKAARAFGEAAAEAGVRRVVFLGGLAPAGPVSKHLAARIETGRALRDTFAGTVELRASMIVGAGSESFRLVRDLATRSPILPLPSWLETKTQPIAITDIVTALLCALDLPDEEGGVYDAPGPEVLSGREIFLRIAHLAGAHPYVVPAPLLRPRMTPLGIDLLTRADLAVARELVQGFTSDVLARDEGIWKKLPGHRRVPFDEAVKTALLEEAEMLPLASRLFERALRALARKRPAGPAPEAP